MSTILSQFNGYRNFVFIGESGSGKSELALNLAISLKQEGREVHFFDLDQTKPLFRSRDVIDKLANTGIHFHFEKQFYDTPTMLGGVSNMLSRENCSCILDVGGNDMGSRALGGFSNQINQSNTLVYFVLNPYRPWSKTLTSIDETLSAILQASKVVTFRIICNPTIGYTTTPEMISSGLDKTLQLLDGKVPIDFVSVKEDLVEQVEQITIFPLFPLKLYLKYPWLAE